MAAAPHAIRAQSGEAPDVLVLNDGKRLEGVVFERFHPDHVIFLKRTQRKEIKRTDIASMDVKRDRQARLLRRVVPGLDAAARWELAQSAIAERLPKLARVLAYHTLIADAEHAEAHGFLGHVLKRDSWRWAQGKKLFEKSDFDERIQDWSERFVLESEHYVLETNTSVEQAVEIALDLERLYLFWMDTLGPPSRCAEDIDDPLTERMHFYVYRSRDDRGFNEPRAPDREPHYDLSTETMTAQGNANVAMTYYVDNVNRPLMLFELGTRQLMYSLLVLAKNRGTRPPSFEATYCHWLEWGLGYWVAGRLDGPAGYATPKPFEIEYRILEDALEIPARGPLLTVREELTNLIGLPTAWFYDHGRTSDIHRAKAISFTAFLIEANEPVVFRRETRAHTRAGLFAYLRDAYGTPTAHSSSAFDEAIGDAKIEVLGDPWRAWMEELVR